jgi:DtxR family Mn-dependent transcriptional regulator
MEKRTKAIEDYLEAILILEDKQKEVHSIEIANFLNVSKPAVAKAMKELLTLGYITKIKYGEIALTSEGKKIAKNTYEKHKLIKKFLLSIGVDDLNAEHDCCLIEHVISKVTLSKLKEYMNKEDNKNE